MGCLVIYRSKASQKLQVTGKWVKKRVQAVLMFHDSVTI